MNSANESIYMDCLRERDAVLTARVQELEMALREIDRDLLDEGDDMNWERFFLLQVTLAMTVGLVWFWAAVLNPPIPSSVVWFVGVLLGMIEQGLARITYNQEKKEHVQIEATS